MEEKNLTQCCEELQQPCMVMNLQDIVLVPLMDPFEVTEKILEESYLGCPMSNQAVDTESIVTAVCQGISPHNRWCVQDKINASKRVHTRIGLLNRT